VPYPVGRNLEAVFEESNAPADENDFPEKRALILQMAIPGNGHEDVGYAEENDGFHVLLIVFPSLQKEGSGEILL